MPLPFRDRHDAGRQLGELMFSYAKRQPVVLGVPRGGVPVAYEVAHALHASLDIFLVRHLVVPGTAGSVLGVVGSGGVRLLDRRLIDALHIPEHTVEELTQRERISLLARERTYRGHNSVLELRNRVLVLVDDAGATEACLGESIQALRQHEPASITVALPVVTHAACDTLRGVVDDVVYVAAAAAPLVPERWYVEFTPISHTEVRALLSLSQAEAQSRELAQSGD